jgi:hypothetical protein
MFGKWFKLNKKNECTTQQKQISTLREGKMGQLTRTKSTPREHMAELSKSFGGGSLNDTPGTLVIMKKHRERPPLTKDQRIKQIYLMASAALSLQPSDFDSSPE